MAARYWVGGTATWDATAGSKWSTASGGSSGAATPTSSDDVYFDAASGAVTVTYGSGCVCKNINTTGFAGTLALSNSGNISIYGSATFVASNTLTFGTNSLIYFKSTNTGNTITTNGKDLSAYEIDFDGVGGGWSLTDNLTATGTNIFVLNGSFDTNEKSVTVGAVVIAGTTARGLNIENTTLTITGATAPASDPVWNAVLTTNLTFSASGSSIKLTNASSTAKVFAGGGLTYETVWFSGAGSGTFTISGSNTFGLLKMDTPPHTLRFTAGTTQTILGFDISGTPGNLMTLVSTSNGSPWNIVNSGAVINEDYLSIRDSTLTGTTGYAGANSTNVSGNSGWLFTAPVSAAMKTRGFFLMANQALQ